jgi:elongation factor Ts
MYKPRHIESYVHNAKIGVLVEFAFEDSLLSGVEEFMSFTHDIAMHIAATNPADLSSLLHQGFVKNSEITIEKLIQQTIVKLGENIEITRFTRWDTEPKLPGNDGIPPKDPAVVMRLVK